MLSFVARTVFKKAYIVEYEGAAKGLVRRDWCGAGIPKLVFIIKYSKQRYPMRLSFKIERYMSNFGGSRLFQADLG